MNKLIAKLIEHGFIAAASNIEKERFIDIDHALNAWQNYPQCMDEYPMQLTRKLRWNEKVAQSDEDKWYANQKGHGFS